MVDAAKRGFEWWNWGGTWRSQKGVYGFKKRWGTGEFPYYYYTRVYDQKLLQCSKEEIIREYPYFYVVPFDVLSGRGVGRGAL
jgi:hypothetical protein